MRQLQRVTVLGDGGWGTTLALHAHRLGHRVTLWGAFPDYVRQMVRRRENVKFLPGVRLPKTLHLTASLTEALAPSGVDAGAPPELVIVAVPSQHLRSVVRRVAPLAPTRSIFVSVAKGLEQGSMKRMTEIIHEELGRMKLAVLSGPNIAKEIAQGDPASAVVASTSPAVARRVQRALMNEQFRLYTSSDVIGVELGGALKNPLAIAAGIADGLGFSANAKAALITRGVVEMARLGVACGARADTFWGLSGLGDLITTCLGGRNHWLGEQIGAGKRLKSVLASTPMVIEGVDTSNAALAMGRKHRVELPLIEQVVAVLFHGKRPRAALKSLMTRVGKPEDR